MKKILTTFLALCLLTAFALPASAAAPSKETLKRLGTFISNFTEVAMYDIADGQALSPREYAAFGVSHCWVNNPKQWHAEKDNQASLGEKNVEQAVARYFGVTFTKHCSVEDWGIAYDAGQHRYFLPMADGEQKTYAAVKDVQAQPSGILFLSGTLYNVEDPSELRGTFKAKVMPHKWNGKDTWALLSLQCDRD